MMRFAKFVAGLLVALTAMPVLAAAPCHQAMHSMKCCSSECPMMANASGAKFSTRTGPELTNPVCCSPSSRRALPSAEQRTTESRTDLATLHSQVRDVIIIVAEQHEVKLLHEGPLLFRPSRIALCTFLI